MIWSTLRGRPSSTEQISAGRSNLDIWAQLITDKAYVSLAYLLPSKIRTVSRNFMGKQKTVNYPAYYLSTPSTRSTTFYSSTE